MAAVRIAVTSDLHYPAADARVLLALANDVAALEPDAFAVAGDVAESLADLRKCLTLLRHALECPILIIPGNHDLWGADAPSLDKWQQHLPEIVEDAGCLWLEGDAFVWNGVAVAGTIAWYDYSAADPHLRHPPEVFAQRKGNYNLDAQAIRWSYSDAEFAELVAEPFLATLDHLEEDNAVRHTLVVTHVPLLECQMCRRPDNADWAFSNAYFGNLTLGAQVLTRPKVSRIVSGHTHVARQGSVRVDGRTVTAEVLGSDYGEPAWVMVELPARV